MWKEDATDLRSNFVEARDGKNLWGKRLYEYVQGNFWKKKTLWMWKEDAMDLRSNFVEARDGTITCSYSFLILKVSFDTFLGLFWTHSRVSFDMFLPFFWHDNLLVLLSDSGSLFWHVSWSLLNTFPSLFWHVSWSLLRHWLASTPFCFWKFLLTHFYISTFPGLCCTHSQAYFDIFLGLFCTHFQVSFDTFLSPLSTHRADLRSHFDSTALVSLSIGLFWHIFTSHFDTLSGPQK